MGSVLLVESDPETRERLGTSLRDAGHEVLYAVTSRDAFHMTSEGGIDVIVVDAYDPRGNTVELARNINSLPDAPPIILLSSSPDAPQISARIGATAFLPKPCDPVDLLAAVRRSTGNIRPRTFDDEPTGPARIYE
ncbi:MAG: response regulator [Kofleriaceae bacterium]